MEDRLLLTTYQVVNTLDNTSTGSLRWAIGQVDGGTGGDEITFAIGAGVQTIKIGSALTAITEPVTIDATQNPNYKGTPLVQIDGSGAGTGVAGLTLTGGSSKVLGLSIINFSGNGITLTGGGNNVIQSNDLGIEADGTTTAANGGDGIFVGSSGNTIGGTVTGQGNLISGNTGYGIELNGGSLNTVEGNLIGVDGTDTLARGNTAGGVLVKNSPSDTIGGTSATAANVVSGNGGPGISTFGTSTGMLVQGNFIGTDATNTKNLGNNGDGVELFSSNNTIGGLAAGAGNVIAFNGNSTPNNGAGVELVLGVTGNAIESNSIYSNFGLGINNGGSGGNNNQPFPTLGGVSTNGTNSTFTGSLTGSAASATYTIQFYSNTVADPSGFGEGQTLIGTAQVPTDGSGNANINVTLPVAVVPGAFITATATDPNGNTSQFAQDVMAQGTADVSVSVSGPSSSVNAGDQATYTLQVGNAGPTEARNVTVVDQIPSGATLVSATSPTGAVTIGPSSVTINYGTLLNGQNGQATIVVQTSNSSVPSITDSATVSSAEGDPNSGNNVSQVTTPVNPVTDLAVAVVGAPGTVPAGQNVTYTVTLSNNGPATATNVVLTDTLPANTTLASVTSSQGTPSVSGSAVTLDLPTLAANASAVTLTITVTTTGATAASISDTASVSSDDTDSNTANNSSSATTTVTPVADMGVTVTANPSPVADGQNLTYTVVATNNGPSTATGITISDVLPSNVTFVSATDNAGGTPAQSAGSVTDAIASLASGGSVTLSIVVTTTSATAASITDNASVSATTPDSNTSNDSSSVTTAVTPVTDLQVGMTATPSSVGAGQNVTYNITAKNNGPSQATGVTLTDLLPANVSVVSVTASQGTTSQTSTSVIASLGALGPNVSATLQIVVMTTPTNPPSITNTISIAGAQTDPDTTNNSQSQTTTVTPAADLAITIAPPTSPVLVNQNITYNLTATNNGPSSVPDAVVTDTLPAGVTFVSGTDSLGHTLTDVGGVVTDTIGTLPSGGAATLTITVQATTPDSDVNSASIASATVADPTPTNNNSLVTTDVLAAANLAVNLVADQSQVTTGHLLTYTATVTNGGPSDATGVSLTETVPSGATILQMTPTQGTTSASGQTVTASLGTIPAGGTATLIIEVLPTVAEASTTVATVSANEVDVDTSDNTSSAAVDIVEPPGTLQFSAPTYTVNDTGGHATIVVNRTDGAEGTVSVKYFTTLTGSAQNGADFTAVSGTLTFSPGVTTQSFTLPVIDNKHNSRDHTVNLILGAPQGGAVLGSPASTTVTIHDVDPDLTPPTETETRLFGTASSIEDIALFFSEGLNKATATNKANFQLIDVGPDGRVGTRDDAQVAIKTPIYNATNNTVTLQPVVPLKANEFYYVKVTGVTDQAGNALSAGLGSLAGSNGFGVYVARGMNLQYPDSRNTSVSLKVTGGGVLDLTRYANGDGQRLQVLNPVPHHTTIAATVRGGSKVTTLNSILGLGVFGQVKMNMTTPPFYVTNLPFDHTILDPPAVDGIFAAGGLVVAKATKKK